MNKYSGIQFKVSVNGYQISSEALQLSEALKYLDSELTVESFLTWNKARQKAGLKEIAKNLLESDVCLEFTYTVES